MANIESHPNNLKSLNMTTSIRASPLSVSLSPSIFLSRRLPRKHTCCANFKSGYTGAITISRAISPQSEFSACYRSVCQTSSSIGIFNRRARRLIRSRFGSSLFSACSESSVSPTCSFTGCCGDSHLFLPKCASRAPAHAAPNAQKIAGNSPSADQFFVSGV